VSGLFEELTWRGLVHQTTDPSLVGLLDSTRVTAYIGFDPTADSLHLGNLLQLCNLRRLQEAGHRPIFLAGGGTGMIGDPGGKSEERSLLSSEELTANLVGIRRQLERFVDLDGSDALLVDNGAWLWDLGLLEFLRDVGKHFTVNQMVAKESVRARLEDRSQGISFTEFTYMLLQAHDFLHLFDVHGCRLQLGGSDQWGNITTGVDLIRKRRGVQAFGLTSPLILRSDGTKFGKSETGTNIWLDAQRTSPYELFQFLLRTEDSHVGRYLRAFTWLSESEIQALDSATAEHPERRDSQRALARAVTATVHGEGDAAAAERAAAALFGEEVAALDERTLLAVFANAPSTDLARSELEGVGLRVVDALVRSGLETSKGAARRKIEEGGVYLNNRKVDGIEATLASADLLHDRYIVLRRGKKDHHLLRFA
jgi:tyrosyl-tRNA synthetase